MSENVMPQDDDRVRVVLEGEAVVIDENVFGIARGPDRNIIRLTAEHVVSVEILSRPMPSLPTKPTPIVATVRGVEDVLLVGPNDHGEWYSPALIDSCRVHQSIYISAWRAWTPEDAA